MSPRVPLVLVLLASSAGCGDSPSDGGGADLAASGSDLAAAVDHDLGGRADLATGHDPDGGACSVGASPSGYKCDPWGVHMYLARFVSASSTTLRLQLLHDPTEGEGNPDDETWPVEHDFRQILTIDVPIDAALRSFLCVAFARATPPDSYPIDAALADFYLSTNSLAITPQGTKRWQNVSDLCGNGSLVALAKPDLLSGPFVDSPALPDVVVMIPLVPDAHLITVGGQVSGWLARGILGADEDLELVPMIQGKVIEVQTQACHDRQSGIC